MTATVQYQLYKRVKDDSFSVDNISSYALFLQVSSVLFRVCVTDTERNRCLLLEDYRFTTPQKNTDQLLEQLSLIVDDHHLLQAGFWKSVKLAVRNSHFSLIPNSLFDKNFLKEYLALNCSLNKGIPDHFYYYTQRGTDAVNIFAADRKLIDFFSQLYPSRQLQVIHFTSPLIEGVMHERLHSEQKEVFLEVEPNHLTILVKHNKTLEFCNTFYFETTEDFLYFVLFAFDQLGLNQYDTPVTLWGDIAPDSPIIQKLKTYVRTVHLGDKPSNMKFGYFFDELMEHSYYDVYSMHLCE
ncbi:MAG: DUF3822 family protein [Cytophagaceae bacterium]|jgi:hypothetical protein|nr:DUF3822 family protein [Cytophagaceae bacterium]